MFIQEKFFQNFKIKVYVLLCVILVLLMAFVYLAYQPGSEVFGRVYTHLNTKDKVIALTFDDGPNGEATLKTLEILQQENIHATFFLVGDNVAYYPLIAKQISDHGNEIGNHTMHHERTLPFDRSRDIEKDLIQTNQVIFEATGQKPKYFRPPFGFRTPWAIDAAERVGMDVVTWNDLTADYTKTSSDAIEKKILGHVRPGSVIVLHDGYDTQHGANRDAMLAALPKIIEGLKQQGYQFLTVSQMFGPK